MKCINCKVEIGQPKKHEVIDCRCGSKLMLMVINGEKQLVDLTKSEVKQ